MTDLSHALEALLAEIERGTSVEDALARHGDLSGELAPLVALALSAREQPGLSPRTQSVQARLLVAEAARLFPPGGPAAAPDDGGSGPTAPRGPAEGRFPLGAALLGGAGALLLAALLSGIAGAPDTTSPASSGTTPAPPPTASAPSPTSSPGQSGDTAEPPNGTRTLTAEAPTASPSPTASSSPTTTVTVTAPLPRSGRRPSPGPGPGDSATPTPTATMSGYPAPTTTEVFAPTTTPAPYP